MHMLRSSSGFVFGWMLIVGAGSVTVAQLNVVSITPVRHGLTAHVDATIRVDFDRPLDPASLSSDTFSAMGRWSGPVQGTLQLANGNQTILFQPSRSLSAGDLITVSMSAGLTGNDLSSLQTGGYAYQFWTRSQRVKDLSYTELATMTTGSPSRPYGGVASDLNNDGWLDITTVNEDSADLRVFMNQADGTGSFAAYTQPTFGVGNRASPSESADFNRDGNADIAVANINDNTISVVLGNGDGTFAAQQTIPVGTTPRGIAVLDVDGDGDSDIVNTNLGSNNLSLHLNNGKGVFGTPTELSGGVNGEWSLMSGDMNNDGILDLVVASGVVSQIRVLTGNGDGTFTQQAQQNTGGRSWQIMLGDVNGDGNLDVSSANAQNNRGAILLGNGDGTLQAASTYNVAAMGSGGNDFPLASDLGDLDGDGDLDWITSSFGGEWIVMKNDGTGAFDFFAELDAPNAASCSLMHDFDNDGDLDLGLVDELANVLILSRNDGTAVADGDFDANGNLDLADIDALNEQIATGNNGALYDLNGDGTVDRSDLSRWLALAGAANLATGKSYLFGDANLDGVVDLSDFNVWNSNKFTAATQWSRGNFNSDTAIDVPDFNLWSQNKFRSADGNLVPEANSWLTILTGGSCLLVWSRMK